MADRLRVLHVDNPDVAGVTATHLERADDRIDVVAATSANEGLDVLEAASVDCVVADYDLPDADGIELLEAVREDHPRLPFVLFTGSGSEAVASEAIAAGVTDYLPKGTGTEQYEVLATRIADAVDRYRADRRFAETERELREKSTLLDNVFEQVPIHLYAKDEDARYVRVSEYYVDETDAVPDAADQIGKTDLELYPEEFSRETVEDDLSVIETGEPIVDKEEYEPAADEWNLTTKEPLYDDGEITGLIGVTRRITTRKEYEERLERQNERLDEFASIVSHDLRNPLTVATGNLELARETGESDHLDDVADALDRMGSLIDDLLTLARMGEEAVGLEPVSLAAVAGDAWRTVDTAAATLTTGTDRTIQADRGRLQQCFENLFRNAVEHCGDDVAVTVGHLDGGFYVEDDGPGVPDAAKDELFEAGYSTADRGTGLGLSIVRKTAASHGWEIDVTDGEDGGARFEFVGVDPA